MFFGLKFEAVQPLCSWTCVHVWELTHGCQWWLEKLQETGLSLCIVETEFKGVHMIWKALRFRLWGLNRFPLHVLILSCQKEIHTSPSSSSPILSTVCGLGEACWITYILLRHLDWNSNDLPVKIILLPGITFTKHYWTFISKKQLSNSNINHNGGKEHFFFFTLQFKWKIGRGLLGEERILQKATVFTMPVLD